MSSYSILSFPSKELPKQYNSVIRSRWKKSLRKGNPFFALIEPDAYYTAYNLYVEDLLSRPTSIVRLAVLTDDSDIVLGFSVIRDEILDFIHVHKDYGRRQGIGKRLMSNKITTFTHLTMLGKKIWQRKHAYKHLKFNPYI